MLNNIVPSDKIWQITLALHNNDLDIQLLHFQIPKCELSNIYPPGVGLAGTGELAEAVPVV